MQGLYRSVFCIWSRALCLLAIRVFGVISSVVLILVKSGIILFLIGWVFEGSVSVFAWCSCKALFLVLNAALSEFVAVSSLMVALSSVGNSTNLQSQLVAFFVLLISISTWYYRLQVPAPICWLCCWDFFHLGIWLVVCGHCGLWYWLLAGSNSIW